MDDERRPAVSRRRLLQGTAVTAASGLAGGLATPGVAGTPADVVAPDLVGAAPTFTGGDWWLGPDMWGNRLGDWQPRAGGWACVAAPGHRTLCTAALLTSRLTGAAGATLSVKVRTAISGAGFAGLLIGTGTDAEHRRTALVGTASGTGGGLLAILGSDGAVAFRDHTDEADQFAYAVLPGFRSGAQRPLGVNEQVRLVLDVVKVSSSAFDLKLRAVDTSGAILSRATLADVAASRVAGGLAVASGALAADGPTYTFNALTVTGSGVATDASRTLGPVIGTLFSQSGGLLKMTVQMAPFAIRSGDTVTLETQSSNGTWVTRKTAPVGAGYVALLRVPGWDAGRATPYRVTHSRGGAWDGTVPAEPTGRLRIATINCSRATGRYLDLASPPDDRLPSGHPTPLYSADNIYFPYEQTLASVVAQAPDLVVAMGDQYYEDSPTDEDISPNPERDMLYKYLQWLWAVRDVTRNVPTLVMVDDHDVFQGNLWGEGGIPAPGRDGRKGGYENAPGWVNLVQRLQTGHNPDPYDPKPVAQGIKVWFTRFGYAGVTFVMLEDRKFKTSRDGVNGHPELPFELLGPRQEAMLDAVAVDAENDGGPVVVLTQTVYACVETKLDGSVAAVADSGGFPKQARDRALVSIRGAKALMLSGDTHLGSLVRHLDLPGGGDGPLQFTAPALATVYQRWFTPAAPLPEAEPGLPNTGLATDGFGNDFKVLAIANPKVSKAEVVARNDPDNLSNVVDRALKREGYGIVDVDLGGQTYVIAAWPGNVDPTSPGAVPYPGWPYTMAFADA